MANYDEFLEQQRAARYDGGDEDERNNEEEEEQYEQGERADEVARIYSEGHEQRAVREMQSEASDRGLKSYKENL